MPSFGPIGDRPISDVARSTPVDPALTVSEKKRQFQQFCEELQQDWNWTPPEVWARWHKVGRTKQVRHGSAIDGPRENKKKEAAAEAGIRVPAVNAALRRRKKGSLR